MANKVIFYEKLRGIGIFLIGISTVVLTIAMVLLINVNNDQSDQLECSQRVRDNLNRSIGRGLVAVARDDLEELENQANEIIRITNMEAC